MAQPTIDEVIVAGSSDPWREAGFDIDADSLFVGTVCMRFAGEGGRGIIGCTMRELAASEPDGLPLTRSESSPRERRTDPHPNGVIGLDHLVAFCAGLDRTIPALEQAGLELRRLREEPTPAGAPRQAFFRLADVILEVIEAPLGSHEERKPEAAARFWGLAFSVSDLDTSADYLGEKLGESRNAVQSGRRIATVRREAGLGTAVAFMTPDPRTAQVPS